MVTLRGLPDYEAATWFAAVYPTFFDESTRDENGLYLADRLGLVEIIQRPGETVFVPGGWHHVVINLDFAVAVTQNFCSRTNFEAVWLRTRNSRPRLAQKLLNVLSSLSSSKSIPAASCFSSLVEKAKLLETVPQCPPSTSSGGSSSSSSSSSSDGSTDDITGASQDSTASESSDEEGRCMCRKCKLRRKARARRINAK